jgi:S1-C subfamily serine protease
VRPSVVKAISNSVEDSGFIVNKNGIIITTNHVMVSNASNTTVQFYDRSQKKCCKVLYTERPFTISLS